MKKAIAILLIFQLASNQTIAGELVKLPALLEHYFAGEHHHEHSGHHHHHHGKGHEHQPVNHNNLVAFMQEHYGQSNHEHHDHEHKNLPFKNSGNSTAQLSILLFCNEPELFCIVKGEEIRQQGAAIYHPALKSNYLQNIWQPPKTS